MLVESIGGLLLYIGLHLNTLKARGCNIPPQLAALCQLNDPKRHAHGIKQLNWEIMKNLVSALSLELEKSYVSRKGFLPIKNILDELLGSTAKYLDYMEENRASAQMSQAGESEPDYSVEMHELPLAKDLSKYSENEEKKVINAEGLLGNLDLFRPVCLDEHLHVKIRYDKYLFLKKLREHGLRHQSCVLFAQNYYAVAQWLSASNIFRQLC